MDIREIVENFQFLDDWDDRYKYLIELGNMLEPMPESDQVPANKVQGCVSQVWLTSKADDGDDPVLHFHGASDAHIVSGLVAIALAIFSGRRATEILACDETETFKEIDLSEHITPQRSNGLNSLVQRIKSHAKEALANA